MSLGASLSNSALLVIDIQNDFCHEQGYMRQAKGFDLSYIPGVIQGLETSLAAARQTGIPVIWIRSFYDFKYLLPSQQRKRGEEGCCLEGSWGADFFHFTPADHDPIVTKHVYSGFHQTDLHAVLQARGIKTLLLTGVATNVCVDSTLRDGFFLGYDIVLVEDAVGSNSAPGHQGTLASVRNNFGKLISSQALQAALLTTTEV
ncbi:MAG: cysteine hydrolase [Pigmentiphaga sp.]|nr:cysteine hydrolase [Pigmentiphaga sp.]